MRHFTWFRVKRKDISNPSDVPPNGPVFTLSLFLSRQTHMKPERGLTILLVSVKYRISETYPVWSLWWSGWAKQPAGFPLHGPTPCSQSALVMKGFCSAVFGTTTEQCTDYIYLTKMCLEYTQWGTDERGGSWTLRCRCELILAQFFYSCYITELLLGRSLLRSASQKTVLQIHYITLTNDYIVIFCLSVCTEIDMYQRLIKLTSHVIGFLHSKAPSKHI